MIAAHASAARAIERDRAVVAEYWSLVESSPDADSCWRWQGDEDLRGHPVLRMWQLRVHATRVAWYAVAGEYPLAVRFVHRCGNLRCVRPSHLRWIESRRSRMDTVARSDGYREVPSAVSVAAECAAAAAALHRDRSAAGDLGSRRRRSTRRSVGA